MKDKRNNRIIFIFSISLLITLCILYIGSGIIEETVRRRMVQFSIDTTREDGAENRVVMIGKSGYLGHSFVYLKYLEDGHIRLVGSNSEEQSGWRKLSEFVLEPGTYTLTGMSGQKEQTIALQLRIEDSTGYHDYIYQYNEDVQFQIETVMEADLQVRVYPKTGHIDVIVCPAVYKEDGTI